MQYSVTNYLEPEQLDMLRGLLGVEICEMYLDETGDFILGVIIKSQDKKVAIHNIPNLQLDGDDYPRFSIGTANEEVQNYKKVIINETAQSIIIFRDEVIWQYNNIKWRVNSDIGIKIVLEEKKFIFIAHDSLAGFIKFIDASNTTADNSKIFDEYWSMKTNNIESLKRMELVLSK